MLQEVLLVLLEDLVTALFLLTLGPGKLITELAKLSGLCLMSCLTDF